MMDELSNKAQLLLGSLTTGDGVQLGGFASTKEALDYDATAPLRWWPQSVAVTETPVQGVHPVDTASGKVGYMLFNAHNAPAEAELVDAINTLKAAGISGDEPRVRAKDGLDAHFFRLRGEAHYVERGLDHLLDVNGRDVQSQLAGDDPAHVEQILDELVLRLRVADDRVEPALELPLG